MPSAPPAAFIPARPSPHRGGDVVARARTGGDDGRVITRGDDVPTGERQLGARPVQNGLQVCRPPSRRHGLTASVWELSVPSHRPGCRRRWPARLEVGPDRQGPALVDPQPQLTGGIGIGRVERRFVVAAAQVRARRGAILLRRRAPFLDSWQSACAMDRPVSGVLPSVSSMKGPIANIGRYWTVLASESSLSPHCRVIHGLFRQVTARHGRDVQSREYARPVVVGVGTAAGWSSALPG